MLLCPIDSWPRAKPLNHPMAALYGGSVGTLLFLSGFTCMQYEEATVVESSVQIAWDYLELAGEIEDRLSTRRFLLRHVEKQFAEGVRNRLLLSNRAIMAYQHLRRDRQAA